ncbi:MAG: hypothetical protein IJX74_00100 [Clostridia bacterium]|nr:hypothetical protein [Clostridia bacterium]
MRKLIFVLLGLLVILSLAACDLNMNDGSTTDTTVVTTEETTEVTTEETTDETTTEEESTTVEETTEETTEDETTTEEITSYSELEIDPLDTAIYNDGFVSFKYPAEWEAYVEEYAGGFISYGELVNITVSVDTPTGIFDSLTKEIYESECVPIYEEMGMSISYISVKHKIDRNDVAVAVIEQTVTVEYDGESTSMEMDIFVITLDSYEITINIMKTVPSTELNDLIYDTLEVVFDEGDIPSNDNYDDYVLAGEALYIDDHIKSPDGSNYKMEATRLSPGESIATKFTVVDGVLSSASIECPSWNDCTGTLVVSVYEWIDGEGSSEKLALKSGYALTVEADPIATQTFINYRDNAILTVYLDEADLKEGGTYLVVLSNPSQRDLGVGYIKSSYDAEAYFGERIYGLPDDLGGYIPMFTTDVVAFNSMGVPVTFGYMNLEIEVMVPMY